MKLAFLCNNMKSTNGVERVLSQRLSLLAESGMYEVYLITYNQYGAPFSFPISDKVHYIDLATRYMNKCSFHGFYQYWDRFVSKRQYENAIRVCIEHILPDVITCVDIHLADLLTIVNLKTDAAKVVECHCGLSAYFGDLNKIESPCERYFKRLLKKKIVRTIKRFDKIVVMTPAELIDWNNEAKAICIPNMLSFNSNVMPDAYQVKYRICSVGRYAYQKGYDLLVDAWKIVQTKHPDWSLHIYGSHDGDMGDYNKIESKIVNEDICNLYLHSVADDVCIKYLESDFYVMSSRYESFDMTLVEAMSCGLPVVSFDCPCGPKDIISHNIDGILVPNGDVGKLADSLIILLNNQEKLSFLSKNAQEKSKNYSLDVLALRWKGLFDTLIE